MSSSIEQKYLEVKTSDEKGDTHLPAAPLVRFLSEQHWWAASRRASRERPEPEFAGRNAAWEYFIIPGRDESEDIRVTYHEGRIVSTTRHLDHGESR